MEIPVSIFAFFFIAHHSLLAATILFVFGCLVLTGNALLGRRLAKLEEQFNRQDNEFSAREQEVLKHMEMVKLHRAEVSEENWFEREGGALLKLRQQRIHLYIFFYLLGDGAQVLPFAVLLFAVVPHVVTGAVTIGTLFALLYFAQRALAPAHFLGDIYQDIKQDVAKMKPALAILAQGPTVREATHPLDLQPIRHQIQLAEVTFRYPDSEGPVLHGITLAIPAGKKTALVGPSGAGKTSLAGLLARCWDPEHGVVTIDGTDIRQYSFDSLYRRVTYVTQDVPIFSGTIGDNVRYGVSNCDDERTQWACKNASANFIFDKPDGLLTPVGEAGVKLSGGERQRLALARIFLRQPSLVILDEATAALDPITEREVQQQFDQLLALNGGVTMVVIAHRLTTVRNADQIVVLDAGRIVAVGPHEQLLQSCELYKNLCAGMHA